MGVYDQLPFHGKSYLLGFPVQPDKRGFQDSGTTYFQRDRLSGKWKLGEGGYKDWMQSKANPVPAVTLEVGSVRCPLPLSQYEAIWQQNKGVWPQAMVWALEQ